MAKTVQALNGYTPKVKTGKSKAKKKPNKHEKKNTKAYRGQGR